MKYFVLTPFLYAFFEGTFAKAIESDKHVCSDKNIEEIGKCYQNAYGDVPPPVALLEMIQPFAGDIYSKAHWKPFCETKKQLNQCIGKYRFQNCFNLGNITKLPIVFADFMAKFVIANFIHVDHICEKLYKFSDADYNCLLSEIHKVNQICSNDTKTCDSLNNALNCAEKIAYKECGKVVGCFQRKNYALDRCYNDIVCKACDGISATNNQIDDVCHNDDLDGGSVEENGNNKTALFYNKL